MTEAFDAVDVILTKRDGGVLSPEQIAWVVDAYTRGVVADDERPQTQPADHAMTRDADPADSREATALYLARNPGLNFIAEENGQVIGCAMCGHDGRRGYLQHVVVDPDFRGRGVAQALVAHCLDGLEKLGIWKTHALVFTANGPAQRYWARRGWQKREDVFLYSLNRSPRPYA